MQHNAAFHQGLHCLLRLKEPSGTEIDHKDLVWYIIVPFPDLCHLSYFGESPIQSAQILRA